MGDLLARLQHPEPHRGGGDVDELQPRKLGAEQLHRLHRDVVELDPEPAHAAGEGADGVEPVVLAPVGVGEVAPEGAPRRLAAVDPGRDRGRGVVGDEKAVAAAEGAVEEVGVVVDVVVRGEERGVDARPRHHPADRVEPALHLGGGEGGRGLRPVPREVLQALPGQGAVHRQFPRR